MAHSNLDHRIRMMLGNAGFFSLPQDEQAMFAGALIVAAVNLMDVLDGPEYSIQYLQALIDKPELRNAPTIN